MKPLNLKKHIGLNVIFLLLCLYSFAQAHTPGRNDFVKFEAIVKFIDSEFVLIPMLTVTSKSEKIQIPKKINYGMGGCHSDGDCIFTLQKMVRGRRVIVTADYKPARTHPGAKVSYRNFGYGDVLGDTIKLQKYYPLEVGRYEMLLQFYYYYKKDINLIDTNWTEFEVLTVPVKEFGNIDTKRK